MFTIIPVIDRNIYYRAEAGEINRLMFSCKIHQDEASQRVSEFNLDVPRITLARSLIQHSEP